MAPVAGRSDALQLCTLLRSCTYHINYSVNLIKSLHSHCVCVCMYVCTRARSLLSVYILMEKTLVLKLLTKQLQAGISTDQLLEKQAQ